MQIQAVEEKTGLDRATIRYYEKEGLIQPQRLQKGYRDYSQKQLDDLMKIKLLRQLGLSLEAIQHLIEGKDDLQSVVGNQLVILNAHKEHIDTAEIICKMIIQDNVTYQTIKPHKYFCAMNQKQHKENKLIDTPKTEYVYMESHPFRRFIGRYLDQVFTSAILMLIVVVLMRVRPFGVIQNRILSVAALFFVMPINAFFLCLFGTTPGKFAVGIHLKTPDGKNPSYLCALRREWAVFRYGCGYFLPIYSWVRLIKSYVIHAKGQELDWDYDYNVDMRYTQCGAGKWIYSITLSLLTFIMIFYSAMDSQFPKHRNEDLTIIQFSENFNDYAKQNNNMNRLSAEGEWYSADSTPVLIIEEITDETGPWHTKIEESWNFTTDENHKILSIQMSTNSQFLFNEKFDLILYTAIMSQPNANIKTATEAIQQFSEPIMITGSEELHYDYNGLIVNVELQQSQQSEDAQDSITLVEILFP